MAQAMLMIHHSSKQGMLERRRPAVAVAGVFNRSGV